VSGLRILVVDDDATSRLIARTAVQSLGHECRTESDGARAWQSFQSHPPEVVISDWMMPGLSGLELCRRVRGDCAGYAYFILVTSRKDLDRVLEGMNAGADDYLVKPLDPDDLQARLIAAARVTALHRQLAAQQATLEELNVSLTDIARRDALTGLANRRAMQEDLEQLEARVSRYGHRYTLALIDVDHFKSYNDTYGHQEGDKVLARVAAELKRGSRSGDALYRYGGDELLCILPEQTAETGACAVERMRAAAERLAIPHTGNPTGVVTLSAGMAMFDPLRSRTVAEVLREADASLYESKQLGRNRVSCAVVAEGKRRRPA
jgi:diguanylate cyclase (GGDEF)-like protein